jgi:hypothetical protein
MNRKLAGVVLLLGVGTMGSTCINDPFLVAVNLQALTDTVNIAAGTTTTWSGQTTISAGSYLNSDFGNLQNVRIYDIRVTGVGTYSGNVTGSVSINGTLLISFTGPWSTFNTTQSLLTSPAITRNAAGIAALRTAVLGGQAVTIAGSGTVSTSPVPALKVIIEVLGQVDAQP